MPYTTALAFLEDVSTQEVIDYTLPSQAPAVEEPEVSSNPTQPGHALSTCTWFPPASRGFVLCRVVEGGYVLELRWISFSRGESQSSARNQFESLDSRSTLPPVRFIFPSRIIPALSITPVSDGMGVQIHAMCQNGYLYVLRFVSGELFYSSTLASEDYSQEFKVPSVDGRHAVLAQTVEEGRIIVACADSYTVRIEIDTNGYLLETELKSSSSSSFSVRAFLPSFPSLGTASPGSPNDGSSPFQLISIASTSQVSFTPMKSYAFGVSRDRKLKIWNLETGACLKITDLPRVSKSATKSSSTALTVLDSNVTMDSPHRNGQASLLLSPAAQPLLRIFYPPNQPSEAPYSAFLVLYTPAAGGYLSAFSIYGIACDFQGELMQLTPVGERIKPGTSERALVDFKVMPMGPEMSSSKMYLWAMWEEAGETDVCCIELPEVECTADNDGDWMDSNTSSGERWEELERGQSMSVALWSAGYFDALLQDNPKSIVEVFADHIFYPGRYPPATLEYALSVYEQILSDDSGVQPAALLEEYHTLEERIRAVVGCSVLLETSPQTGAALTDIFDKNLKREWLRFVAVCNESRGAALCPLAIEISPIGGYALIILRDAIATPILQEPLLVLHNQSVHNDDTEQASNWEPLGDSELDKQSDISSIFSICRMLTGQLSPGALHTLDCELVSAVRATFTISVDDVVQDLYERLLEPYVSDALQENLSESLKSLAQPEESFQYLWSLLTTSDLVGGSDTRVFEDENNSHLSDLSAAVLTDALSFSIETRYTITKQLVALLLFIFVEEEGLIAQISSLIGATLATFHSLASLKWISNQSQAPALRMDNDDNIDDGMSERFGEMSVKSKLEVMAGSAPSFSLLNGLLRSSEFVEVSISSNLAWPTSLLKAASTFLCDIGLMSEKSIIIDEPADVSFAFHLQQIGLPHLAAEFAEMYPCGVGMLFVLGCAYLEVGRIEESQIAFGKAAASSLNNEDFFSDDTLRMVLPQGAGSLGHYYRHVISLFSERSAEGFADGSADVAVIKFAQLAIEAFSDEGFEDDAVLKEIWLKSFRSSTALGLYEQAYSILMAIPFNEARSACLAHLVSVMCEQGDVQSLVKFSFTGLQGELERNLAFRARNSDPLASPNYYNILYAYHMAKGDYRSAGASMMQQARRIGELPPRSASFREWTTMQCQSFLASINALAMLERQHAWVAILPGNGETSNRESKRRKIPYYIPNEELENNAMAAEVLDVEDIRQEYTIALSRLQLVEEFPELERASFGIDAEAVVALFSQIGSYDNAFSAAHALKVDMSSLFEILTEKCIGLSLNMAGADDASWVALNEEAVAWEGSLASRAWQLLRLYLQRHDNLTHKYRKVVLERVLAAQEGSCNTPAWLSDFFLKNDAQSLIRASIKYDRLQEAFLYSVTTIKSAILPSTGKKEWLPYSLYDELLSIAPDECTSMSSEALRARQRELREALDWCISIMEKAGKAARLIGR